MSTLDEVRAKRAEVAAEITTLLAADVPEERDAADAANAAIEAKIQERDRFDTRIGQLEADEKARQALADARNATGGDEQRSPAYTEGKDLVYPKEALRDENGFRSYFVDLARAAVPGHHLGYEAAQRLQDHAAMLERVPPKDLPREFRAGPHKRMAGSNTANSAEVRVNPSRIGGQGGYFVPPIWLIDDYVPYLRAGRVTADRWSQNDLPPGTDSINLPKLTLGTLTGVQQDNGAVTSQDITDTFVTAPVRTIAGQEDIAIQLLDQSPVAFDNVILKDLMESYNQQLDIGTISGSGSNGQLKGLLNISGTNAVTYTTASPTFILFWPIYMQALSQIAKQRFMPPTAVVMHPSTWYFLAGQLDGQNRPFVLPGTANQYNPPTERTDLTSVQGLVSNIAGVDIYVDANVPTNLGASSNQAPIFMAKFDDLYLYEGAIRSRALVETLSGTLQVRIQLWNYVAALVDRFPTAVSVINGTGQIVQSGF